MEMLHRKKHYILFPLCLIVLTGCWSSQEIEELSFGIAKGIDLADEESVEQEMDVGYPKRNLITLTDQIILPEVTVAEGPPSQKPYQNVSHTGDSIHEMLRENRLERNSVTSHHLKAIVIGEGIARKISIQNLINQLLRDNVSRRSSLLLIAKGKASETLETQGKEIPGEQLKEIATNESTKLLQMVTIGDASSKMASNRSFLLQSVVKEKEENKFAGAAIIQGKTKKLVGFLSEEEIGGISWITAKGKGGLVKTYDEEKKQLIVYEILSMKSRIKPMVQGNEISFDVKIKSEGRITEDWLYPGNAIDNDRFLKAAEKEVEGKVRRMVEETLTKIQKEYEADVAGFGTQLGIHYPRVWEKVEKDWDKEFSQVPVNLNVKINIKTYSAKGSK
ncbi:Ger(x)C family spore germination protein [Metabacillus arenae]|uniref:Ger(X)C family spore germination protein n=1 Tax=Metabacillus arenae TaxID=2771434 RepID=A0A926RXS6_9BACI|nr:Ger(x)C family spore germination protein [Metabacillus arenae]MBD1382203.1 Ger(x)C family spore germination protein [Metabacillus arenae]